MAGTFIPRTGTVQPRREDRMSSAALAFSDTERARRMASSLERIERARGGSLEHVRPRLADKLGVSTGTLETLRRGRLKRIEGWLRDRIASLLMREIGAEITRLRHELELARQSGSDPRWHDLSQIRADLEALEAVIPRSDDGGGEA